MKERSDFHHNPSQRQHHPAPNNQRRRRLVQRTNELEIGTSAPPRGRFEPPRCGDVAIERPATTPYPRPMDKPPETTAPPVLITDLLAS